MRKDCGREVRTPESSQDGESSEGVLDQPVLSSYHLKETDAQILEMAAGCPTTLMRIAKSLELPYVECLKRAKRLEERGLLRRLDGPSRPGGLHLYIATGGGSS